ncbi:MAG: hypothetical protein CFE22_08095 [Cytophagaceae bacterium BCCC1]|nr:MAG: hypothetical protein CFE22_08095 [Cytophagaceae bacterium BCCC1]
MVFTVFHFRIKYPFEFITKKSMFKRKPLRGEKKFSCFNNFSENNLIVRALVNTPFKVVLIKL